MLEIKLFLNPVIYISANQVSFSLPRIHSVWSRNAPHVEERCVTKHRTAARETRFRFLDQKSMLKHKLSILKTKSGLLVNEVIHVVV